MSRKGSMVRSGIWPKNRPGRPEKKAKNKKLVPRPNIQPALRPYAELDLDHAMVLKGNKAAVGIPDPFPVFIIDEINLISGRDLPA
jgi:hypothetical protein